MYVCICVCICLCVREWLFESCKTNILYNKQAATFMAAMWGSNSNAVHSGTVHNFLDKIRWSFYKFYVAFLNLKQKTN